MSNWSLFILKFTGVLDFWTKNYSFRLFFDECAVVDVLYVVLCDMPVAVRDSSVVVCY